MSGTLEGVPGEPDVDVVTDQPHDHAWRKVGRRDGDDLPRYRCDMCGQAWPPDQAV